MISLFRNTSLVFYCIYLFHKTHIILKGQGINKAWDIFVNNVTVNKRKVDIDKTKVVKIVNHASIYHRNNNQCLEKAFVLYRVLHKLGFTDVVLFIGVDNYPFKSHAWVEFNKEVINDSHDFIKSWKVIKSSERRL